MKVFVTGASGFLGKRVLPLLVQHTHQVSALTRSTAAARIVSNLGAIPLHGDLNDPASVIAAFETSDANVLVNLASLGFGHADTIITAAEAANIERAVFISTTAIFTTLNAASRSTRVKAEAAIQRSALSWTILRPTMIYGGPDDRNMARLLRFIRRWHFAPLPGSGKHLQQPVHVEDLANIIVSTVGNDLSIGRIYDIAGPEPMTFREMIREATLAVGRVPLAVPLPLKPMIWVLRGYEKTTGRSLPLAAEQLERLAEDKAFDITSARTDLRYDPRPFKEGIRQEASSLV